MSDLDVTKPNDLVEAVKLKLKETQEETNEETSTEETVETTKDVMFEFTQWDGWGKNWYCTTEEENAIKVELIANIAEYQTNLIKDCKGKGHKKESELYQKPLYRVHWTDGHKQMFAKSWDKITWNDYLYCLNTNTGYFVCRDKNKQIFISHNSDWGVGTTRRAQAADVS